MGKTGGKRRQQKLPEGSRFTSDFNLELNPNLFVLLLNVV